MSKSWKDHFLKSGVPLEYDVARILAEGGMGVDADYSFLRQDASGVKEWSVDIAANFYGVDNSDNIEFEFRSLIECKYRSKEKVIVLLPDPNVNYPPMTLGGTIGVIDHVSGFDIGSNAFVDLESELSYVYKAMEVYDGGAFQEDIRHGIQQLRYATPSYMARMIDFSMGSHPDDIYPIFFSRILVTNAPMRIMNDGVSMSDIMQSTSLDDVSSEIDRAILFSDYGPDYEEHFRNAFSIGLNRRLRRAKEIKNLVTSSGKKLVSRNDPEKLVARLSRAERFECFGWSTQFFIVNMNGLKALISSIKSNCKKAYDGRIYGGVEY